MVCIVSAYYKIPSKCSHEWYIPHLIRWFRSIGTADNVHFFTTEDVKTEIMSLVPTGNVVFHILPFESLTAMELEPTFWERQYSRDPETYHSPELGMIWFEKQWFVNRIIQMDPSPVFVWCDAGCVRDERMEDIARLFGRRGVSMDDGKIHLQQVSPILDKPFYSYPDTTLACAIIIGNRKAWENLNTHYMKSLLEYDEACISAISDQYVLVRCVQTHPEDYMLHTPSVTICNWFSFLEVF